ncbi:MAG: type II secretion system protein [Bacilli bacterium]
MKNKKGFTLIELLAVIAILAILVVLTVPNILGMFNKGKKSAFVTQSKEILSTAQSQYVVDSLSSTPHSSYCWDGTTLQGATQLSGDTKIKYNINFDDNGKVIKYQVTDTKNYGYDLINPSGGAGITSINVSDTPSTTFKNITCPR